MDKNTENSAGPARAEIAVVDAPRACPEDALCAFAREVLGRAGAAGELELAIAFVGDAEMARLNEEFRGVEGPTDVLSFPLGCDTPEGRHYLGDVAISLETAARQAEERGIALREEIFTLAAHGIIHLCGLDHESDDGEMARLEESVRRELLPRYC